MTPVQSWINKGTNAIPLWATPYLVGRRDPNGSFLIKTPVGIDRGKGGVAKREMAQARVLPGYMLIERNGLAYARHPSEAKGLLAELDDIEAGAAHLPPIGPAGEMADVAPLDDDTDEISHRIEAEKVAIGLEKSQQSTTPKPQISAAKAVNPPRESTTPQTTTPVFKGNVPLGIPPSIEMRHPSELRIDDSYQRSIDTPSSQALVKRIAHGWDWRMCLPLVVSRREDGLYVIDGQHRLAAAQMRGDIHILPCCMSTYSSIAEEAAMFVAMNRTRRPINRLDDHHAAVASGDGDAIQVDRLITSAGFTVARRTGSQSWVPGEVAFTASIQRVLRKHGEKVCADALRLMSKAFPDEVLNAGASIFLALAKIAIGRDAPDEERLLRALLTYDQKGWASFVLGIKGGGEDRALALKSALLMAYEEAAYAEVPA